jgi:hypothetical protein
MEVDFLCDESRLAVELDGAQHLADPDAYRRDRRKDQLFVRSGVPGSVAWECSLECVAALRKKHPHESIQL